MHKKSKSENEKRMKLLQTWFGTDYQTARRIFIQTFGKELDTDDMREQLDWMDEKVRKAPTPVLKELVSYIEEG